MDNDYGDQIWHKFLDYRMKPLDQRFSGHFRAVVVETNDPLNLHRVKFKCPDLHDWDLQPQDCPWAVPSPDLGGKRAGRWVAPMIGDWIWITFERGHPYGPIWTGFANPTRRKMYPYPSVFNISPVAVNDEGQPTERPNDYIPEYLPKDGRPMSHGWQDRYGNLDISSAVGFFPFEHIDPPPPPDVDGLQDAAFRTRRAAPEVNAPDRKYMLRATKYGNMILLADQGYYWQKEPGSNLGEFTGNFAEDEEFEIARWKNLQQLVNEGVPNSAEPLGDQRRVQILTRYGHVWEMRDVGWAQLGPRLSMSRDGEFGPPRVLSQETERDMRWVKWRTKGGMLLQMSDIGFDPAHDKYIQRTILDASGTRSEREDEYWAKKDARWMRLVSRYGLKFVIDDRGSHPSDASEKEVPHGNGILLKGRRTPGAHADPTEGDPRGFFWEFNENDDANHTMWGSPMGLTAEMNDRYQYMMLAASMGPEWVTQWQGIKENEFNRKPMMIDDPENNSHHLKLDHENEYVRLKTRSNRGAAPFQSANPSDVDPLGPSQGFEARDGVNGMGPWVELVDSEHRGLWFSKNHHMTIWRARQGIDMMQWMNDNDGTIVMFNDVQDGRIQIFCNGQVDILASKTLNLRSDVDINIWAGENLNMFAGGSRMSMNGSGVATSGDFNAFNVNAMLCNDPEIGCPSPGGAELDRIERLDRPQIIEPDDRGKTYNGPFEECPLEEVEHPLP